jgi:hypothetical protein
MYIYDKQSRQRHPLYRYGTAGTHADVSPAHNGSVLPRVRGVADGAGEQGQRGRLCRLRAVRACALPWAIAWVSLVLLGVVALTCPPSVSSAIPLTIAARPVAVGIDEVRWGEPAITPDYWVVRSADTNVLRILDGAARSVRLDRDAWHIGQSITVCAYQRIDTAPLGVVEVCQSAQPSWLAFPFVRR